MTALEQLIGKMAADQLLATMKLAAGTKSIQASTILHFLEGWICERDADGEAVTRVYPVVHEVVNDEIVVIARLFQKKKDYWDCVRDVSIWSSVTGWLLASGEKVQSVDFPDARLLQLCQQEPLVREVVDNLLDAKQALVNVKMQLAIKDAKIVELRTELWRVLLKYKGVQ